MGSYHALQTSFGDKVGRDFCAFCGAWPFTENRPKGKRLKKLMLKMYFIFSGEKWLSCKNVLQVAIKLKANARTLKMTAKIITVNTSNPDLLLSYPLPRIRASTRKKEAFFAPKARQK